MGLVISKGLTLRKEFQWNETVWNPGMISTALWLDAADASTITESSGAVSQWNDKSGTGNHAVNATPASQPRYQATGFNGLPALSFDATGGFLGISSPVELASNADFFYAAVFQMRSNAGIWRMVMGGRGAFNTVSGSGMPLLQRMAADSQIGIHNTDFLDIRIKVDVANLFAPTIATVGRAGGTFGNGGTVTVTATGPSQASYLTTGTQSWASAANTVFQIGGRQQSGTAWFDGTISECVALNRNATTLERQKIEGYLAHKWDLTASLPSDHPYKTVGPTP
jgi:hypothetical protein